ncbi:hypothetical protein [Burkholderia cepacia]|uniref:hypothetical protein n=1 Tax=Burkholderia cepacia TaxID=292 RepID=UPI00158EA7E7|nr:hypothetical protein [Burkholderia cepacia]
MLSGTLPDPRRAPKRCAGLPFLAPRCRARGVTRTTRLRRGHFIELPHNSWNLGLDTRSLAVQPRAKLLQTDISITVATEHIPNILIHDVQAHFSVGIIQSSDHDFVVLMN